MRLRRGLGHDLLEDRARERQSRIGHGERFGGGRTRTTESSRREPIRRDGSWVDTCEPPDISLARVQSTKRTAGSVPDSVVSARIRRSHHEKLTPAEGVGRRHTRRHECQRGTAINWCLSRPARRGAGHRQHHDLGADADAAVEVADILVGQADAARGHALADGDGRVGAVDAVDRAGRDTWRGRRAGCRGRRP